MSNKRLPDSPTEDTPKQKNDIALRLYRLRYSELNDFSQEFVDDVVRIISTAQLQLVTELEASKIKVDVPNDELQDMETIEVVPLSVLEYKKQELERGE